MHWMLRLALVGIVVATTTACGNTVLLTSSLSAQEAASGEPFTWEGELSPGQQLEIIGRNGRITAEPSSSGQVEVRGERRGHDADGIRIEVTEHADGVTIEAIYPERDWWPRSWFGRSPRIDFSVAIPPDVDLVARSRNGSVSADGLGGNVEVETRNGSVSLTGIAGDARVVTRNGGVAVMADGNADIVTRNGRIRVEAGGHARARTRNGSVRATLGGTDWTGDSTFETRNGSVTVRVPETADADVSLRTNRGSVRTDLPLDAHTDERDHLAGRLGDGGRSLLLKTRNGSIRLLAAQ